MNRVSLERLHQVLSYDQNTGIFKWRVTKAALAVAGSVAGTIDRGYNKIWIDGKQYRAHRLAWFYVYGEWPKEIDHKNRNKSDTRLENLREVTRKQNSENTGLHPSNTSGARGVTWNKKEKKWAAQIKHYGKLYHLGWFRNFGDAVYARREKERSLFTHSDGAV